VEQLEQLLKTFEKTAQELYEAVDLEDWSRACEDEQEEARQQHQEAKQAILDLFKENSPTA